MAEHIIWQNYELNLDDWRDDLLDDDSTLTEEELYRRMIEQNDLYLSDERRNLNIQLGQPIIAIADIGRWNGRRDGYRYIRSGNIGDCLYSSRDCDYAKWYVDDDGDLRCEESHHDGTNYLRYRVLKKRATEAQISRLESAILEGTADEALIKAVTSAIGPHIAKVYGWKLRRKQVG